MSKCVINSGVSVITREGNLWVVDGKYKVSDLSTCKVVTAKAEENIPAPSEPVQEVPVPIQVTPPAPPPVHRAEVRQVDGSTSELNQLLSLAGDNAWLVAAALLFVFGKQYLEKMEKMKLADTRTKDDLTKECTGRHSESITKATELASKLEGLNSKVESLTSKLEAISNKIEATKGESLTQTKGLVDAIEKRVMAVEMEVKYQSKPNPPGRPKKGATEEE
jgi:outer membrane murein-binding lipoprotein Lpp